MNLFTRNMQEATSRLKSSQTLGSFPRRTTLTEVLSTSGCVYDLPTCVLPRQFKQGTVQSGTEFVIDFCKGVVDQVIVRGSKEIVVTLQQQEEEKGSVGIKSIFVKTSQSRTGCLAFDRCGKHRPISQKHK